MRRGELLCVVGPNGAGKTTLINALAGILRARGGRIAFDGRDLTRSRPIASARADRRRPRRPPAVRADDGSREPRTRQHRSRGSCPSTRIARRGAGAVPGTGGETVSPAGELSGGQQQMVAVGRALMARPRLLLLDEPSLGLSPMVVNDLFETVRRINAQRNDGDAGRAERAARHADLESGLRPRTRRASSPRDCPTNCWRSRKSARPTSAYERPAHASLPTRPRRSHNRRRAVSGQGHHRRRTS